MGTTGEILIVDDDARMRELVAKVLAREGYSVRPLPRGQDVLQALEEGPADLIISDIRMPEMDGLTLLQEVKRVAPETSVLLMTAFGSIDTAVQAIKAGAYDYLTKPFKMDEIIVVVRRAMEERRLRAEVRALREEVRTKYNFSNILGKSKPMLDLFALITKVAGSRSTVLIQGKSGTGKELVAKAIHYNSPRRERPLVTVNCSAIPKDLLESELFGHVKGAFTGAIANKRGLFEEADGGSLFLDEIGELSPELQVKLLRVIQEREIRARRRYPDRQRRCPAHRRHQPRSRPSREGRHLPGGPVLPAQRHPHRPARSERPRRGHPLAGHPLPDEIRQGGGPTHRGHLQRSHAPAAGV